MLNSHEPYVINISGVIDAIQTEDINLAVDRACEFGFTLGEISEKDRWVEILDKLESSLISSEEDAKLTIHIIRKLAGVSEDD
jgi:hypothetical protein